MNSIIFNQKRTKYIHSNRSRILVKQVTAALLLLTNLGIAFTASAQSNGDMPGFTREGVNGRNVQLAKYAQGRFQKTGPDIWKEFNAAGIPVFSFKETNRDEWSVYISDSSRNVQIQIDLYRMKILYGTNGGAKRDLYSITSAGRHQPPPIPSANNSAIQIGYVADLSISDPVNPEWRFRGVGDVDGDGTDDIIWQIVDILHKDNGQLHYWRMINGERVVGINIHIPVGPEWQVRGVGDVDGDGTDDIVWQKADILHKDNGQLHYWRMIDGKYMAGINIHTPVGPEWQVRGVGDVDGNGTDDIIWQHNSGQVHYWRMSGGRRLAGKDIYEPVSREWHIRGVGDINSDQTDDIVMQNDQGWVHYWAMSGGKRAGGVDINRGLYTDLVGVGDVNGDGFHDLIWSKNRQLSYWKLGANGRTLSRPKEAYKGPQTKAECEAKCDSTFDPSVCSLSEDCGAATGIAMCYLFCQFWEE